MSVAPPRPKGPHLNALRAFESAARLGSFAAAAEELSVTPGAIAQHIKSLEAWANSDLFERRTRGVELTPLGAALLPEFTAAFDRLGEAVQALRTQSAPNVIRIATLPSLAQLWLAERLGRLRELAPDVTVSVVALEAPPNLTREPFDATLFFSSDPPEQHQTRLFQDRIFPVCAPAMAQRLRSVADLNAETLLHDSTWAGDWSAWLQQMPGIDRTGQRGPTHSLFSVAVEEACHGAGVLMAHEALVQSKLKSGELVAPFEQQVALDRYLTFSTTRGFERTQTCALLLQALRP